MKDRNYVLQAKHKLIAYMTTNSNKENSISGINLKKEEISKLLQVDEDQKKSNRKKYRKIPKTAKWQIYREIIKTKIRMGYKNISYLSKRYKKSKEFVKDCYYDVVIEKYGHRSERRYDLK